MFMHLWAACAALRRPAMLSWLAFITLLSACSAMPDGPVSGRNPADHSAPVAAVGYRSTIAPYQRQRPVEPAAWSEQNQRVAPQPRQ